MNWVIPLSSDHYVSYTMLCKLMFTFYFHLLNWCQTLMEDEPEKYQSHFSEYIKREIEADDVEEMYKKVHAAIRADPAVKKSEKQPPKEHKRWGQLLINFWVLIYMHMYLCITSTIFFFNRLFWWYSGKSQMNSSYLFPIYIYIFIVNAFPF